MNATVTILRLISLAQDLRGDAVGENPEYDRALVELVADAAGLREEDRSDLARVIGISH